MSSKTLLPFVFCLCIYSSFAQTSVNNLQTKSLQWTSYKLGFQAPSDLVIKESSSNVYYAGSDHIFLTIYPKKGDSLTHDQLQPALQKWAASHKLNLPSSGSTFLPNNNRLWNYYIGGSGYKGMSTYVAIVVDSSHPADSYYVWLQYQNGYADAAMNILNTLSIF